MFKHLITFESLNNFQITAMVIFFLFFFGVLLRTFRLQKPFIEHMENLPVDDDPKNQGVKNG